MKRILVISDIHGAVGRVERLERVKRHVTIAAGDLAECGSREEALEVLDRLEAQGAPTVWVPGNCDDPSLAALDKAVNVHGRRVVLDGLVYAGAGGSLHTPFGTPFEYGEDRLASILGDALRGYQAGEGPLVLVVHTPPYRSGLDRVSGGSYVGSRRLREIVAAVRPLLLATGHIHEAWGVAAVGPAVAVNPGPLAAGRYALVDIDVGHGGEPSVARVRTMKL